MINTGVDRVYWMALFTSHPSFSVLQTIDTIIIIITIVIIIITLLLLLTAIEFSLGGSSPYNSTDKTNKNKYTRTKQNKKQYKIQNTVNTSTRITKPPTNNKTHTYTHPHITKQVKTTTAQNTHHMK